MAAATTVAVRVRLHTVQLPYCVQVLVSPLCYFATIHLQVESRPAAWSDAGLSFRLCEPTKVSRWLMILTLNPDSSVLLLLISSLPRQPSARSRILSRVVISRHSQPSAPAYKSVPRSTGCRTRWWNHIWNHIGTPKPRRVRLQSLSTVAEKEAMF